MFQPKIRQRESGILIYGICPPKVHTPIDKVLSGAEKLKNNLADLDIDALVVYDVQDESARTSEERPFPFVSSLDPLEYSTQYLNSVEVPRIIYRAAGMFSADELNDWLDQVARHNCYPVFVGLPSPDYVPKTSLGEAYELWRNRYAEQSIIGAVTIPERHAVLNDEQIRILEKVSGGVSFFISQCIFHVDYTTEVLSDLVAACHQQNREVPTMIFTLTICGSAKTLRFMEWLGIFIPADIREELSASADPVANSLQIATAIANELIIYCKTHSIPFGFNIESVAIRREEIEASLQLVNIVRDLLVAHGVRSDITLPRHKVAT